MFTASFLFVRSSRSRALRYRAAILVSNIPRVLASWFRPSPLSRFDPIPRLYSVPLNPRWPLATKMLEILPRSPSVWKLVLQTLSANAPAGTVFDVCERLVPPGAVAVYTISDSFSWRHGKLSGIMWTATARGGTSRSHTLNTVSARLAERVWCTKIHSLRECIDHW